MKKLWKIFRQLFICRSEIWMEMSDQVLIERYLWSIEYKKIVSNQKVYLTATDIQSGSLDEMIKEILLELFWERSTYYLEIKNKSEKWEEKEEMTKKFINLEQILNPWWKYLLRAHVWQGKSIWLTEFIKYAILQNKEVIFYESKELESLEKKEAWKYFHRCEKKMSYTLYWCHWWGKNRK